MSSKYLVLCVLCACPPAPLEPTKTISFRMTGSPPDARVTVDDQIVGSLDMVQAHGVALPPGSHRVSVEAPGYFPLDRVVEVHAGDRPIRLEAVLVPVPD